MKYLWLIFCFLSYNLFAANLDYAKVAGRYDITYSQYPIHNEISINLDGSIGLKEYGSGWIMYCKANTSTLIKNQLYASLKCDSTVDKLTIFIDFNGVTDFTEFQARYSNSIYDLSDFMDFRKLP